MQLNWQLFFVAVTSSHWQVDSAVSLSVTELAPLHIQQQVLYWIFMTSDTSWKYLLLFQNDGCLLQFSHIAEVMVVVTLCWHDSCQVSGLELVIDACMDNKILCRVFYVIIHSKTFYYFHKSTCTGATMQWITSFFLWARGPPHIFENIPKFWVPFDISAMARL